jgi:signal transduction histidine kinase
MRFLRNSLRNRIFFSMIVLTLISSVLIAGVSIYQSREQARDYHNKRLERKEQSVKESISYTLKKTSYEVSTANIPLIFKEEIYIISDIHEMPVVMYDMKGRLVKTSKGNLVTDSLSYQISDKILHELRQSDDNRYVIKFDEGGKNFRSSYSYIVDVKFKNIAILHLPYLENDDFMSYELREFLMRLSVVYLVMFIMSIALAYFLSRYITRSLSDIKERITGFNIAQRNQKIRMDSTGSEEINALIKSYNDMVDELEESAVKLATSEREQAWREMAKQVAHEIKNPLTPMRLTVQSFQRRFDPTAEDASEKINEFSNTIIEQIDIMSHIASTFSTYATMPAQQREEVDVPKITQLALDIFNESYIEYAQDIEEIYAIFDRTQLIRVVTNLVKNAIQALDEQEIPSIKVLVTHDATDIFLTVTDNGSGIHPEFVEKIFEPKFTTKSSGMGLGLAMVKQIVENFKGTITVVTAIDSGTTFTVTLPRSYHINS